MRFLNAKGFKPLFSIVLILSMMKRDSANPGAEGGVEERGPEPGAADDTAPAREQTCV